MQYVTICITWCVTHALDMYANTKVQTDRVIIITETSERVTRTENKIKREKKEKQKEKEKKKKEKKEKEDNKDYAVKQVPKR